MTRVLGRKYFWKILDVQRICGEYLLVVAVHAYLMNSDAFLGLRT
jgi:hypothetical protein